jgi:hypothetical protein
MNTKYSINCCTSLGLMASLVLGINVASGQICTPSAVIQGNSGTNSVLMGTTGCAQVPGAGRLQVKGDATSVSTFNYAGNFLMPPSNSPVGKQNMGILSTSGQSATASGLSTTGGKFEAYGGSDYVTGIEANAKLDLPIFLSTVNVTGVNAQAWTNKAMTSGFLVGLSGTASFSAGGSAGTASGVHGATGYLGTGTIGVGHGVYGLVYNGPSYTTAYGLRGDVQSGVTAGTSFGSCGITRGGATRYGMYGEATSTGAFTRLYGVFGRAPMVQAIPITNWNSVTSWAGYFDGHVQVVGSFTSASDRKLKQNEEPIANATVLLRKLQPKSYLFNADKFPGMNLPRGKQFGLIAQEVMEVLPALVLQASHPEILDGRGNIVAPAMDYLAMNYQGLTPILIAGFKEQQLLIENQEKEIAQQRELIDKFEQRLDIIERNKGRLDLGYAVSKGSLFQNAPNPFSETTIIRFNMDSGAIRGAIRIADAQGKLVWSAEELKGPNGQVMVPAGQLGAGSYTYSLLVDGELVDSKVMVVIK